MLVALGVAGCTRKELPAAPTATTSPPTSTSDASAPLPAPAAPTSARSSEQATEIPPAGFGTAARLTRTPATACGGTLVAGADVGEAMVEALFAAKGIGYTQDGRLVVSGTLDYSEVAPMVRVRSCSGEASGYDVAAPSAFAADDVTPIDAAAWKRNSSGKSFGTLAVRAFARPLTTLPDPSWSQGADEIRALWVELAHDPTLTKGSGFLAIVGKYGSAIKVLAIAGASASRASADKTIPLQVVEGAGRYFVLLPAADSGLTEPDADEAWMRGIDVGSWRLAYVWHERALRRAGVVPLALKPDKTFAARWHAQLVSATYEATSSGLVGHELWRGDDGATRRMDRSYPLDARELGKLASEKALRPTSYAAPQ